MSPTSLDSLHPDILLAHVLSRLDGPSLAAAAASSSLLNSLSSSDDHVLWTSLSASAWPSVSHPLVSRAVSSFPSGHRSFFSDAYPVLDPYDTTPSSSPSLRNTSRLISAVDIHYAGDPILSGALETETDSGWFLSSPFRIDLLGRNDPSPSPAPALSSASEKSPGELNGWLRRLERDLTLSWILIDPSTKRAASVARGVPVWVRRHWLTGEVQARYAAVIPCVGGAGREAVCVAATVTCRPGEGNGAAAVDVREVSLQVEDVEGKVVSGGGSMAAIAAVMSEGKRRIGGSEEGKMSRRRYEEYEERKREYRERRRRRERIVDLACVSVGAALFVAFLSFLVLFR